MKIKELKIRILCFLSLNFVAASSTIAQHSLPPNYDKYIKYEDALYSVFNRDDGPMLSRIKGSTETHIRLPIESAKGIPVVYDIVDGFIYLVSIYDLTQSQGISISNCSQCTFQLIRLPIDEIDSTSFSGSANKDLFLKAQLNSIGIYPLQFAFGKAIMSENKYVYYDLIVSDSDNIHLYILEGGILSIWKYRSKEWENIKRYKFTSIDGFNTATLNQKKYLFSKDGSIYEIEGTPKIAGKLQRGQSNKYIFDKDKQEVLSIQNNDINFNKPGNILTNAKKIF